MRILTLKSLLRGFFSIVVLSLILTAPFPATAVSAETGLLWKLEAPSGKVSYLFGTMHSDDPRINDFSPSVLQALQDSEAFMMETLPPSDPSIYFMQNETLRDLLKQKELEQVLKLADFHAMHTDAAMRMKPWLLAMVFDLPKPQTPYAQDVQLFSKAQDMSKEILGLEDTDEHFGMLDSFSREDQLTMLRAVLKRSQKDKQRDFETLLKAYLAGDTAKIATLDDKLTGSMLPKELWTRMRTKLLDERNERMAERIKAEAANDSVFVAVGASHLAGKGGLIERLRSAGYQVSAVK